MLLLLLLLFASRFHLFTRKEGRKEGRKESSRERKLFINFNIRKCPKSVHKNRIGITLACQDNEETIKQPTISQSIAKNG